MTIKECYDLFNGDYSGVLSRLSEQSRVEKFAVRFLDTKDYEELVEGMNEKDWNKVFLASHTIKGIALNLGFNEYAKAASNLCEYVRPLKVSDNIELNKLFNETKNQYEKVFNALNTFKETQTK